MGDISTRLSPHQELATTQTDRSAEAENPGTLPLSQSLGQRGILRGSAHSFQQLVRPGALLRPRCPMHLSPSSWPQRGHHTPMINQGCFSPRQQQQARASTYAASSQALSSALPGRGMPENLYSEYGSPTFAQPQPSHHDRVISGSLVLGAMAQHPEPGQPKASEDCPPHCGQKRCERGANAHD